MYTCSCGQKFESEQAYAVHKAFCKARCWLRRAFGQTCSKCGAILYEDGYCPRCRK